MNMRAFLAAVLGVALAAAAVRAEDSALPSHAIAMNGEPKYGPKFSHFDYVNPDAPKGGDVRRWAQGGFDSFNPFIIRGRAAAGIGIIYDSLMGSSADEPFTMYGLLAETITTPKDRSWVSFTLRENARWHDGKPITVEDVIWTFNTLVAKGAPFYRFYYGNVAKVEQTGPRSVTFRFKPGENRELALIMGQLTVLPKHYWANKDFEKTSLEPPLGSGPYRVKTFEANRFVTYERVENYWGKDLPANRGRYNFGTITFDYYRDSTVALEAFKAGEFDYRPENSSKAWATAYDLPAVKEGRLVKKLFKHGRSAGMQGFVFNLRRPKFKDAAVRRALAYAFDFEWSNKALFYGQYTRTESFFANAELASTGMPTKEELAILEPYRDKLPKEVLTTPYQAPRTDGSGNIRANLRQARRLLNQAGWKFDKGRRALVQAKTGQALAFEVLLVSPQFERVVLPFKKNLERLGVNITVRTVDSAQYRKRLDDFDFDMVVGGWGQSLSPGNEQREFWTTAAATRPGSRNLAGLKNPVVDELVEKLIAAPSRESLVHHSRALDRVLLWQHIVIPNWHIAADRVVYWNKFGMPDRVPMQGVQFFAWRVDYEKEGALKQKGAAGP